MKIILKKYNNKTSYNYTNFNFINNVLEINDLNKLNILFENSFNKTKTIYGFECFLKENENKLKNSKDYLFLDFSNSNKLFMILKNEDDLLNYVQDLCEARGENIVDTINSAINYLIQENVYISKIEIFDISLNDIKKELK